MEQVFWNEIREDNADGCIEFPKLKQLSLVNLPNLTAFCQGLENIIIKFPNLKLKIINLPKLNSLCSLNSEGVVGHDQNTCFHFVCNPKVVCNPNPKDVSFCNLKSIYISECHNLRYLFSVSVARRSLLQLEVLEIEKCDKLEGVFWNGIRDDNTDGCIEFPELEKLKLWNLPNLTGFCEGLEKKDALFCNLKSIEIWGCDNLIYLFSVSVARTYLLQLEVLQIEKCDKLEQVFLNEINNTDGCIEFQKLKKLKLRNLPNLTAFCQGLEKKDVSFCNLESIYILECHNLRNLFSVSVATRCLLQLEILYIKDCESMEQVFWNEIRDNTDGCIEFPKLKELILSGVPNLTVPNLTAFCQGLENIIVKFPNLTELKIQQLPNLNCPFPLNSETVDDHTTSSLHFVCNPKDIWFCNLKSIYISGCDNLRYLFSVSVARRCLSQLEFLKISDCESMEQVFWNEIREDNTNGCIEFPKLEKLSLLNLPKLTAFFQGLENIIIKFPNLTEVKIDGLPKLNSVCPLNSERVVGHDQNTCFLFVRNPKDVWFCNLKSIYILQCHNLRYLLSLSVARRCLLQLEVLCIEYCEAMEKVFWNEVRENNTDGCIEFPKLKELTLHNLPNLTAFCQGLENIIIKFPNLTKMSIGGLHKLNSLFHVNSETVIGHDQNTCFHFVCNTKVEMSCLKDRRLACFEDNIRNIWCHQIPNNVFNNLKRLNIGFMNGIRSLMSTSIAKNLVSLEYLTISYCKEMVEVIERDDDDKQVVDHVNCLFPNLRQLNMWGMHKLRRFWQWNHVLELSLLQDVNINNCPVMETFTLGSINTPNIGWIKVNGERMDHKDLNDAIRHIWTLSQDKSKADGDKNGNGNENENENKDESKDECNNENVNKDKDSNERK